MRQLAGDLLVRQQEESNVRSTPRLERESPLQPYVIAEIVCREAMHHVCSDVPMRYETWLVRRTRQLYATNNGINRRLRSAAAREWLFSFLRHCSPPAWPANTSASPAACRAASPSVEPVGHNDEVNTHHATG